MDPIDISSLTQPSYIGSVQRLYYLDQFPELMVCETTSGGSVFDVGTLFYIDGSDLCRTALRHRIYTLLHSPEAWQEILGDSKFEAILDKAHIKELSRIFATSGAQTHHLGMLDGKTGAVHADIFPKNPSNFVLVKRYPMLKPEPLHYGNRQLWDYSSYYKTDTFVVPLENIVRFGITSGSSIYLKYRELPDDRKNAYLRELNLGMSMKPWVLWDCPTIDYTTKHESTDRNLSVQEALLLSGCDGQTFVQLSKMSILGSLLVTKFFQKLNLQLWDLKWEMAKCGKDLIFVDTLDTDSIRITTQVLWRGQSYQVHFNKQAMRDYYKIIHPLWYAAVNKAKTEAKEKGAVFQDCLKQGQKEGLYPETPEVQSPFLDIQSEKFETLFHYILGRLPFDAAQRKIYSIAEDEIEFYANSGALEAFKQLNRVTP